MGGGRSREKAIGAGIFFRLPATLCDLVDFRGAKSASALQRAIRSYSSVDALARSRRIMTRSSASGAYRKRGVEPHVDKIRLHRPQHCVVADGAIGKDPAECVGKAERRGRSRYRAGEKTKGSSPVRTSPLIFGNRYHSIRPSFETAVRCSESTPQLLVGTSCLPMG